MSKKLNRFLKNLPPSKLSGKGLDRSLVDDLFGLSIVGGEGDSIKDTNGNQEKQTKKGKKKVGINDIPDKVLQSVCEYLKEGQLKTMRMVSKRFNDVATDVFLTCHTRISIDNEDKVFSFNDDLSGSFKFPFSRFRLILEPIKRHLLMNFIRAYDLHILDLSIEPFERKSRDRGSEIEEIPQQRLIHKLTGVLGELRTVEQLDIMFPAMGHYDYFALDFKVAFDLEKLQKLSIGFATSGFCKFSADLTVEILRHTLDLKKLRMKLPEPCNMYVEPSELHRVLTDEAAKLVPSIALMLLVESNDNPLIPMLIKLVATEENTKINALSFRFGPGVYIFKEALKLMRATRKCLRFLKIQRRGDYRQNGLEARRLPPPLRLPTLPALRFLEVESHKLPICPIDKDQFPVLEGCVLHLNYGNETFYLRSILTPLNRLKLHFHDTSIVRHLISENLMPNLFSVYLTKLELVNPPPEHLTFMGEWAPNIETLILSAPNAYGQDQTYPLEKVLAQLQGTIQLRDYYPSHLQLLPKLLKLHLLIPIDEKMALYLAKLRKLWQLIVDDTKVSPVGTLAMKSRHVTYISWLTPPND